jgi:hypothetical protein
MNTKENKQGARRTRQEQEGEQEPIFMFSKNIQNSGV